MAEDNNIKIEIVLDDGSIQKGFAKIKSEGKKASEGLGKEFTKVGNVLDGSVSDSLLSKVKSIPIMFGGIAAAATAAGFAMQKAFDLTLEAENVERINKQFDLLSKNTIGSSFELRQGLDRVSNGLIDTEELLQSTNKVLVDFRGNASDLPKLLELALKAAKLSGEDALQIYEQLNKAVATGNARALQQVGIVLDVKKAQDDYAESIGKATKNLSEQEQRQATLNALLKVSSEQLKDIDVNSQSATNSYKRFSVQIGELGDSIALITKAAVGGLFGGDFLTNKLSKFNDLITSELGKGSDKAAASIAYLTQEIKDLNENLAVKKLDQFSSNRKQIVAEIEDEIRIAQARLDSLNAQEDDARKASRFDGSAVQQNIQQLLSEQEKYNQKRLLEEQKTNNEILKSRIDADQAYLNYQLSQFTEEQTFNQQKALAEQTLQEQERINEESHQLALNEIRRKYAADATLDKANMAAEIETLELNSATKRLQTEAQFQKQMKAIEKSQNNSRLSGWSSFFGNLASLSNSGSRELFEIGKASALAQATIDGYAAVVKAYDFGSRFGPATAAAFAAAAGVAQAVNISRIAGTTFGDGGSSIGSSTGASVPSIGGSDITEITKDDQLQRQPKESLVVNVNGDILGDEASGRRLVELMNSAFDTAGVSLREGIV